MRNVLLRLLPIACVAVGVSTGVSAQAGDSVADSEWENNLLDDAGHFLAVVDGLIAPGYEELDKDAILHLESVTKLCDQPGTDALDAARESWLRIKMEWKRVQITAIGPAMHLRTHRHIDFWPHRQPLVDRILSSNAELTAESMGNQSIAAKGLNVLEHYLFDNHLLEDIDNNRRICDYMVAVAGDIAMHATRLSGYWASGSPWRSALLSAEGDRILEVPTFSGPHEAWQELFNVVLSATYNIRRLSLIKPAGLRLHTRPRPELAEGCASRSSVEFIRSGIEGLNEIVVFPDSGIAALLAEQGHAEMAEELQRLVAEALTAAGQLKEPYTDSIYEQRELIEMLDATLRRIQVILQVEIPRIFDIVMYFRDLDGD